MAFKILLRSVKRFWTYHINCFQYGRCPPSWTYKNL